MDAYPGLTPWDYLCRPYGAAAEVMRSLFPGPAKHATPTGPKPKPESESVMDAYPGLTPWANTCRPLRGLVRSEATTRVSRLGGHARCRPQTLSPLRGSKPKPKPESESESESEMDAYPGLTPWANTCRPLRGLEPTEGNIGPNATSDRRNERTVPTRRSRPVRSSNPVAPTGLKTKNQRISHGRLPRAYALG